MAVFFLPLDILSACVCVLGGVAAAVVVVGGSPQIVNNSVFICSFIKNSQFSNYHIKSSIKITTFSFKVKSSSLSQLLQAKKL